MATYKAEFADEEMEVFEADTDSEAINEAYAMEEQHDFLLDLFELDSNYNEARKVF